MNDVTVPRIDLRTLQGAAAEHLTTWASAAAAPCPDPQTASIARAARAKIYEIVRDTIPNSGLASPGIYLFCDLSPAADGLSRLVYIGIVKASHKQTAAGATQIGYHTLGKRMWDHLAKECGSLQPRLRDLDEQQAEREILAMLQLLHNPTQAQKYVRTHMKGRLMSRADTILLFPVQAPARLLEEAETALIRAARPRPGELHELVNKQKMKSNQPGSARGMALAEQAIKHWERAGLGAGTSRIWLKRVQELELGSDADTGRPLQRL